MRFRRANLISTRNTNNFHCINNCSAPAIFCLTMKMKVGCKMCILQDFALTLQKLKHLNVILSTKAKVFRMIKLFLNICMHDILGTLYTLFVFFTAIETYLVRKKVWEMYLSVLDMDDFQLFGCAICTASDLWLIEMYSCVFHFCLSNVVSKMINVLIWNYLVQIEILYWQGI